VQVFSHPPAAGSAIGLEQLLEFGEQIRLRSEVAQVLVAFGFRSADPRAHLEPRVTVEGIAFDDLRPQPFAIEDVLETFHDRGRTGPGGAGDRDHRVLCGHVAALPQWPLSGR
jgi:hypothetical protein